MGRIDSSRSVTFSWLAPLASEQNGVIISYTLNITETGSGQTIQRSVLSSQTSVTVNSLLPFTTYSCSIAASTSIGMGPFSTLLTVVTPEDGKHNKLWLIDANLLYPMTKHGHTFINKRLV